MAVPWRALIFVGCHHDRDSLEQPLTLDHKSPAVQIFRQCASPVSFPDLGADRSRPCSCSIGGPRGWITGTRSRVSFLCRRGRRVASRSDLGALVEYWGALLAKAASVRQASTRLDLSPSAASHAVMHPLRVGIVGSRHRTPEIVSTET